MRLAALSLILATSLAATTPAPKAAPPAKTAAPETKAPEFPKNEAGGRAASWFQAFNAGEASMKRYLSSTLGQFLFAFAMWPGTSFSQFRCTLAS